MAEVMAAVEAAVEAAASADAKASLGGSFALLKGVAVFWNTASQQQSCVQA